MRARTDLRLPDDNDELNHEAWTLSSAVYVPEAGLTILTTNCRGSARFTIVEFRFGQARVSLLIFDTKRACGNAGKRRSI
jgi:hypothetical protein